jgi:sulfite exporter TauE/SafE
VNAALLGTALVASLAGSLHCAGMCGGFVAFYAASGRGPFGRALAGHLAYNGGRLATYLLLGALAGWIGSFADLMGSLAGTGRLAAVGAGVLVALWGAWALLQALNFRLPPLGVPKWAMRAISRAYRALEGRPPVLRATLLGLLSTMLPCGWLYAFAVLAAGTGSPANGMLVMAAFWAGTVPVMLGLGSTVHLLSAPLRRKIPAVTAAMLIVVGLTWVGGRMLVPVHSGHAPPIEQGTLSPHGETPAVHPHDAP